MSGPQFLSVAASAPGSCEVCRSGGVMRLVLLLDVPTAVLTNCPHCQPREGCRPVPVPVPPPFHIDTRSA